jgi:hypothetical protein
MTHLMFPIDHNTTWKEIDTLEKAFFTLFKHLPEVSVTGTFTELKTNECIFARNDKCEILKSGKRPVFAMFDIDGENCKATVEDTDQCILNFKCCEV